MNLFALDLKPHVAATYHCDQHVGKMILETAQLLCTAHRMLDGKRAPIKRRGKEQAISKYILPHWGESESMFTDQRCVYYWDTHHEHPCGKWARASAANYRWAYALMCALGREFEHRFKTKHKTIVDLQTPLCVLPSPLRGEAHRMSYEVENFALAMPPQYKDLSSAINSYRSYYANEKREFNTPRGGTAPATWTRRERPEWFDLLYVQPKEDAA